MPERRSLLEGLMLDVLVPEQVDHDASDCGDFAQYLSGEGDFVEVDGKRGVVKTDRTYVTVEVEGKMTVVKVEDLQQFIDFEIGDKVIDNDHSYPGTVYEILDGKDGLKICHVEWDKRDINYGYRDEIIDYPAYQSWLQLFQLHPEN